MGKGDIQSVINKILYTEGISMDFGHDLEIC